jgi:hypothetical protein
MKTGLAPESLECDLRHPGGRYATLKWPDAGGAMPVL